MAFDLEKVEGLLNSIGLDLMMVSTENLVEISDLLGQVEPLAAAFAPLESDLPGAVLEVVEGALTAVLRGQVAEVDRALALVGEGLTFLADLARSLPAKAPFKGDLAAFKAGLERLITSGGFLAEPTGPAEPTTPPPAAPDAPAAPGPSPSRPELSFEHLSAARFKAQFIAAVEELQVLLVTIEQKNDPQTALGELNRNFRTILGAANLVRLKDAAGLAYNAAGLIDYVMADHLPYSTGITDILLVACEYLLKCFRGLEIQPDEAEIWTWRIPPEAYTPEEMNAFNDHLWLARQGILPAKPVAGPSSVGAAQLAKPRKIGEILVAKGLISQGDLGGLIAAQQNDRKATLGDILVAQKLITPADLEAALAEQKKNPGQRIGEILVRAGKVDYEQIDQAVKNQEEKREAKLGEFLLKSKIGAPDKVALALREQKLSEVGHSGQVAAQTVKVETLKLDGLIDLVGELVIAQSLITSSESINVLKEQKLNKDLAQVSRITSELQRTAMSLRMVQIGQTFQKMNRLVRDLAHKFEKDVKFETIGSDTEVDRNMVDSIYDPLVHLVRNSLDHGLETPAERKAAGKSPQGTVKLKAYHQGGNVVIELMDDGRGLNTEKVLKKAVEQGLASPGDNLSEAAVHALIFQPGFSTADTISEVSGRGVGLDVVKHSIEKLRGKVDFTSQRGRGSTLTIRLPLTLAIIDGMIVRVGEHRYILPTISILESFRPPKSDYFTVKNQGELIRVRDRLVPLVRLDRLVGAGGGATDPEEALVVMVENEGESRCLLVDQVVGKQEVVIKSLGESLKSVRALAGGTILGDGRVGLILDVAGLFEEAAGLTGGVPVGGSAGDGGADDWGMNTEI
ncbi:MAG: chemotaxis protein CheA [Candidatus Adiutrix sp.]|jgi:chemotaxis protein histidine kinase CheA|nr:chemotaxis protein CheA [Candidatus Adiutrix sp.]